MNEVIAQKESLALFYEEAARALASYNAFIEEHTLGTEGISDHIGYKCGSRSEFETLRTILESASAFIFQSIVSGRPIAIIKLSNPIPSATGDIEYLELSDQKPDGSQQKGFDHVEFVPTNRPYAELRDSLVEQHVEFVSEPRGDYTTDTTTLSDGFRFRMTPERIMDKILRDEIK